MCVACLLASSDPLTSYLIKPCASLTKEALLFTSFTDEEIKAQSGQETCPKPHSKKVGELRFEHRQPGSGPKYFITKLNV